MIGLGVSQYNGSEVVYHFDKIRILFRQPVYELHNYLPYKKLKELSHSFYFGQSSKLALQAGYRSRIEISAPSKEALSLLSEINISMDDYKISYLEIARDEIYSTKEDAILKFDFLLNHIRKKYTYRYFIYKQIDDYSSLHKMVASEDTSEMFSSRTGYWGADTFKFVVYPRISKMIGQPCIHSEWRMRGAYLIKEKTEISHIRHLVDFDCQRWFRDQEERFLSLEDIDHKRHGRFIQIKMKGSPFYDPSYDIMSQEEASHLFCNYLGIHTPSELRIFYKTIKEGLKKKVGAQCKWESVISKMSSETLSSFFLRLDNL